MKEKETSISVKKLCTLQPKLDYYIESAKRAEQNLLVLGWCVGAKQVSFTLLDEKGNILPTEVSYYHRRDLKPVFPEQDVTLKPGFQVKADLSGHADVKKVTLIMEDGKHRSKCTLSAAWMTKAGWHIICRRREMAIPLSGTEWNSVQTVQQGVVSTPKNSGFIFGFKHSIQEKLKWQ